MLVALAVVVKVLAMGMQNVEVGLRPREGDIEQPPLFFNFGVRLGRQI